MVEKLTGKLRLATKPVDNPRLRRLPKFFQPQDFSIRLNDVENHRLAKSLTESEMNTQQLSLRRHDFIAVTPLGGRAATHRFGNAIESALAYRHHLRLGSERRKQTQRPISDPPDVPRMNPDRIDIATTKRRHPVATQVERIDADHGIAAQPMSVSIKIGEAVKTSSHGTGS